MARFSIEPIIWCLRTRVSGASFSRKLTNLRLEGKGGGRREAPCILFLCGASSSAPRGGDIAQFIHSSASVFRRP